MNLTPPKAITFLVSLVIVLLGILAAVIVIPGLTPIAIWVVVLGYVVLAAGVLLEGV